MNLFELQQGRSRELQLFPHVISIGNKKNNAIQLESLQESVTDYLRIYYIIDGKFEWCIGDQQYLLYPGDTALVLPRQKFSSVKGFLEIGTLAWVHLCVRKFESGNLVVGDWSSLTESERHTIGNILRFNKSVVRSKTGEASRIFLSLQNELLTHEIGFYTRVNQLLDELLVMITRQLTKQNNSGRDFPKIFLQLEQKLRDDLSHQWSIEEMAATVGMGTTLFNERVKTYTGFTPGNYLINLRISESIKLLRNPGLTVTDIALDTGFYSSQHFSTTFKKLTGYTPSEFRKRSRAES
jgi:AraC-like DNA-binding protein